MYVQNNELHNKYEQECVPSTWMPHSHYHFLYSVDREIGVFGIKIIKIILYGTCVLSFKLIGIQLHQKLPWPKTLTWSGTDGRTNERTDGQMNGRTNGRTNQKNIMPLSYRRWGIKTATNEYKNESKSPDLGKSHTECNGVKKVWRRQPSPTLGQWCTKNVTVHYTCKTKI